MKPEAIANQLLEADRKELLALMGEQPDDIVRDLVEYLKSIREGVTINVYFDQRNELDLNVRTIRLKVTYPRWEIARNVKNDKTHLTASAIRFLQEHGCWVGMWTSEVYSALVIVMTFTFSMRPS